LWQILLDKYDAVDTRIVEYPTLPRPYVYSIKNCYINIGVL